MASPIAKSDHEFLAQSRGHAVERGHDWIRIDEILEPANRGTAASRLLVQSSKRKTLLLPFGPQQLRCPRKLTFRSPLL
jgi:hypothetical protein